MRPQIYADFIRCIDPGDRDYFRRSRETQLGVTPRTIQCRSRCVDARADRGLRAAGTHAVRAAVHCRPGAGLRRLRDLLGVPVGAHRQPARCAGGCDENGCDPCVAGAHGGAARRSGRSVCRLSATSIIGSMVSAGQACRNSQNRSFQVLHRPAAHCRSRVAGRPKDRPGADRRRVHTHSMDRSPISAEAATAEYTSAFVPPGVPALDASPVR